MFTPSFSCIYKLPKIKILTKLKVLKVPLGALYLGKIKCGQILKVFEDEEKNDRQC